MFDFLKKFKKECVSTYEKLEKAEEEIEEHESNQIKFSIEQYINNFEMQMQNEPQ